MHARFLVVLASLLLLAVTLPVGGCGDNDNTVPCCPVCGDGVCSGDEKPCSCTRDCREPGIVCAIALPNCGDGICQHGVYDESHERCPVDCPLDCRLCGDQLRVYVPGRPIFLGSKCPEGTTESYRDSGYLVCNDCTDASDCPQDQGCHTQCGPGCEDDTGSCCPVRACSRF